MPRRPNAARAADPLLARAAGQASRPRDCPVSAIATKKSGRAPEPHARASGPRLVAAEEPSQAVPLARHGSVAAIDEAGTIEVVAANYRAHAHIGAVPGYAPSVGDRVLVLSADDGAHVIAVTASAVPRALHAPDGTRAELEAGGLALRDREGRLLVRYVDGHAEIAPPTGDLRLTSATGRVAIAAATDVCLEAGRDVAIGGGRVVTARAGSEELASGSRLRLDARTTALATSRLDVRAKAAELATREVNVVARSIRTSAAHIATTVDEISVTAERIVESARERVLSVSELFETRAERVRTLVRDLYALTTRRTTMRSSDDTAIDGRRVLLG